MKLKLDENLSRHLKGILEKYKYDVSTAAEEGLLSKPDTLVAEAAGREGRILLTLDVEFADLRKYPPGQHPGVVLFRPKSFGPLSVNQFIERFFQTTDLNRLAGCVIVVDPQKVRIRRPSTSINSD
jgi:predicted nuclease of predicted toxin-antitoxin system